LALQAAQLKDDLLDPVENAFPDQEAAWWQKIKMLLAKCC
jgi:hypothetical protein